MSDETQVQEQEQVQEQGKQGKARKHGRKSILEVCQEHFEAGTVKETYALVNEAVDGETTLIGVQAKLAEAMERPAFSGLALRKFIKNGQAKRYLKAGSALHTVANIKRGRPKFPVAEAAV